MTKASDTIALVSTPLAGLPVYLAGSLVAEETYGLTDAHDDVDLFVPSDLVLIAALERLLGAGYTLGDRAERTYSRWLRFGFKKWHTNSIKMDGPGGVKINLVYKLCDGNPTTSLSQVIESFDFGLLATGYDLQYGTYHDFRPGLFPGWKAGDPLPLLPNKRENWRNGFISQYNGLREAGRYAKYTNYGHDMSLVKDDLLSGYYGAALYLTERDLPEKVQLGKIYEVIADHILHDRIDELLIANKEILYTDSLDVIMEALE